MMFLIIFSSSFLSQFDGSFKRWHIKSMEVMDIHHGKNHFDIIKMAHKCNQCENT